MGEVYRARDTRLSREVAIKVLPEEVAGDRGRLSRFEKEARAASALNHPNIVTIYDMGSADSTFYIAMERVEGSTLRELLVGGPLPTKKLLQIATQIAEGLAKAHEAGIVHRDLKPENVMVTKDGLVKILDFGLAKLSRTASGSDDGPNLPTETRTSPGVVVGTASYMSPEQASGEAVDFRSDQFAFGSILYEMATGRRTFQKKTGVDTLAAILNDEPEAIGGINPFTPAPLRWIVERCHGKAPEDRYASTRDLARELASLRDHLSEASASGALAVVPGSRRLFRSWQIPAALALLTGLAIGVALRPSRQELPRYTRLTFNRGQVLNARFAPDGQTIVYGGRFEDKPMQLFSTRADSGESTALALPSANILSISASGKMAIALDGTPPGQCTLAEVSLAGGAPRQILTGISLYADWSPDGKLLAVVRDLSDLECPPGHVLYERPGDGVVLPRFSPDGKSIAFVSGSAEDRIMVVDVATKKARVLSRGWQYAAGLAWHPKTGEVWFTARELAGADTFFPIYAVSPNGRRRLVARAPGNLFIDDISREGRVLFTDNDYTSSMRCLPPGSSREIDLSWLDFSGSADLSDDGSAVLFDEIAGAFGVKGGVYLRKTDRSPAVRLGEGKAAALSPDGKWALSISPKADRLVLLPTGAGESRTLGGTGLEYGGARFFPGGKQILFSAMPSGHPARLYVQDLAGGDPRPLTPEGFEIGPVSPDGKWIALRDRENRVVLYPVGGGEPRTVSGIGTDEKVLRWDATGEALFVMKAGPPVRIDRLAVASGRREFWKELPAGGGDLESVQLTPDGKFYVYTSATVLSHLWIADGLR
jgi:Tol biopolymer transport system component/predicted Ser/Thr protein kinase